MQRIKFLLAFILPIASMFSFTYDGWYSLIPLIIIFILFPAIELLLPIDEANSVEKMADDEKNAAFYDWLLYLGVVIYLLTFGFFLLIIANTPYGSLEFGCRVGTMGLICGIFGFNLGHELSPVSYTHLTLPTKA